MGRATVRAALVGFLSGIPGVTTLYKDAPWEMLGDNWSNPSTGLPGTPAFLHLNTNSETRITLGGPGAGQKQVIYDVSLMLLYQYIIPPAAASKDVWVDGLDTLLDSAVARIRSDPSFGTGHGGVIWQAGEDDNDITVSSDLPHTADGGLIMAWNRVDFKVREIVVA
jgi:hypothetical protein